MKVPSYSSEFFDEMQETNLSSARATLPHVWNYVQPTRVCDIGCGRGLWLKAALEQGAREAHGYDGEWVKMEELMIPAENFTAVDLEEPLPIERPYDMAICLEVAEHLRPDAAGILVESLTKAASVVLFSAAIPLQGGSHHVNEQWSEYWEEKFATHGFVPVDCIRRHIWNDGKVSFFYAQNIIMYVKESALSNYPKLQESRMMGNDRALSLVHPFMYTYYAERWRSVVPFLGKVPVPLLHFFKKIIKRPRI